MAIDKVMMGEKTDRESSKEERERVALHELGHAIVAELVRPGSVSQVGLPRGGKRLVMCGIIRSRISTCIRRSF